MATTAATTAPSGAVIRRDAPFAVGSMTFATAAVTMARTAPPAAPRTRVTIHIADAGTANTGSIALPWPIVSSFDTPPVAPANRVRATARIRPATAPMANALP